MFIFNDIHMEELVLYDKNSLKYINDAHMEELVLYYKSSLKYKDGFFWRFSYVYTIN